MKKEKINIIDVSPHDFVQYNKKVIYVKFGHDT